MSSDQNKSYYLVTPHTGRGLTYEVYASYDYVRVTDNDNDHGCSVTFEPVDPKNSLSYKIRMNGSHWPGSPYLTISGKGWVYLDTKENATEWLIENLYEGGLARMYEAGLERDERFLSYVRKDGSKNWLETTHYENMKGFKVIAAN
ncbi:hypothetical protein ACU5CE_33465 [Priestia megaterium]|uniref:hypothetical protein n=1 Tax=Priestia megaterium TaxID=1404 RepID=UPI00406BB979